ncbi:type 1 glutamine amidotransferase domain-containing protein [Geomonas anaerohicana]|uniref:Type 1 glutamine amidotransferase domain-containing protein n=1 Tax=Geomonas anaerohicana TaxID=2798583 RepID=A0ABS0YHC5_9BACT|nr:type 1 glutamine amidotransferase domain-containing protein [Geomonas anaerohicana]MBJ6751671.1 type 1 glutamine amidotransferase domain-containing protein [Geomonas anaerohicana]
MKILMVVTSHDKLGDTGEKTGFWLEELAAPYYVFRDAGAKVTIASPKGGMPPVDPKSNLPDNETEATRRFKSDQAAQDDLAHSLRLHEVSVNDYDAVFFPGGHGPLWDLAVDPDAIALIEAFTRADKPIGAVCHAPAVLGDVTGADGDFLVRGKRVTGFTNAEEEAVGLTDVVPFLLEDRLKERGAQFRHGEMWGPYTEVDGRLVTGQNPASSAPAAEALLKVLTAR